MFELSSNGAQTRNFRLGGLKLRIKRRASLLVSASKLNRIDGRPIASSPNELRLFAMARNESLRLPYFLEYYFGRGVDRIFLIDNDSTDDTSDIALAYDRVHLFRTTEGFKHYSNWMELLLDRYGDGHWCMAADIDEIFCYPHAEVLSINDICEFLEHQGYTAMQSLLLDMYSGGPIDAVDYRQGEDPLSTCPYFDVDYEEVEKSWLNKLTFERFKATCFRGNLRKRVFETDPCLTKVPLFKYGRDVYPVRGMHGMDGVVFSNIRGVTLHFKYLQDFAERVVDEAAREEHECNAEEYKKYAGVVARDSKLSLISNASRKFEDSAGMVALGLMSTSSHLERFVHGRMEG